LHLQKGDTKQNAPEKQVKYPLVVSKAFYEVLFYRDVCHERVMATNLFIILKIKEFRVIYD
jgi:hypothetical protein